ncbi:hypothetical protein L4C42_01110 [Vibrio wakamikoensis]|uniref:hypothetical protein n=1 Tax=Vibrio wakamikoensis TaxID=2910251 RepID=UPI003D2265AE
MKLTKPTISLFLAASLYGCGGGNNETPPSTKTIKVIDGYLQSATVCIDTSFDGECNKVLGKTNANGEISIAQNHLDYPLIATVTAGMSQDKDRVGYSTHSYSMTAPAGSEYITPFTTLALQNNMEVPDVALALNLEPSVVAGDYIALKESEMNQEAYRSHAAARGVALELTEDLGSVDYTTLELAQHLTAAIDEFRDSIQKPQELDKVDFVVRGDIIERETVISDLQDHLIGEPGSTFWYEGSLHNPQQNQTGIMTSYFNETEVCDITWGDDEFCDPYKVEQNRMEIFNGDFGSHSAEYLYLTNELSLLVYPDLNWGDLSAPKIINFYTTTDITDYDNRLSFDADELTGRTFTRLLDVARDETDSDVRLSHYTFINFNREENIGLVEVDGISHSWKLEQTSPQRLTLVILNDDNVVYHFSKVVDNPSLFIVVDDEVRDTNFSVFIQDEQLAQNLLKHWEQA